MQRVRGKAMSEIIRVLVAKPGLDGHDRGARVIALALKDAGMEVIYTGLHQTAEMVVEAALQEDVDVVALSSLSGAHMNHFPRVRELLDKAGATQVLVVGGGIVPDGDREELSRLGIGRVFGPGTDTRDVIDYIHEEMAARRANEEEA